MCAHVVGCLGIWLRAAKPLSGLLKSPAFTMRRSLAEEPHLWNAQISPRSASRLFVLLSLLVADCWNDQLYNMLCTTGLKLIYVPRVLPHPVFAYTLARKMQHVLTDFGVWFFVACSHFLFLAFTLFIPQVTCQSGQWGFNESGGTWTFDVCGDSKVIAFLGKSRDSHHRNLCYLPVISIHSPQVQTAGASIRQGSNQEPSTGDRIRGTSGWSKYSKSDNNFDVEPVLAGDIDFAKTANDLLIKTLTPNAATGVLGKDIFTRPSEIQHRHIQPTLQSTCSRFQARVPIKRAQTIVRLALGLSKQRTHFPRHTVYPRDFIDWQLGPLTHTSWTSPRAVRCIVTLESTYALPLAYTLAMSAFIMVYYDYILSILSNNDLGVN